MVAQRALFDTNILIDYLNGIPQARDVLVEYHINPAISAITWMEVMVGDKKQGPALELKTRQFLGQFLCCLLPMKSPNAP
ncbi:Uncharacterised protein [Acinetobacter baumannii]|nr:Uncharacterised protein [Acinetobacter baumannii]